MHKDIIELGIDAYKGQITDYDASKVDKSVRKAFVEIIGTETPSRREFSRHEKEVYAILEEILDEVIDDGWDNNPFFQQFVEYRNLALGDSQEFYVEDQSMLSVAEISKGHWNLRRQRLDIGQSFTVKVKTYGVKVYAEFLRFLAGRTDWAQLINKIGEAMRHKIASEIYANFMGTAQYLPTEFKATGSFSEDSALELADHVQVANNYAPIVIAGTRKALRKITGVYGAGNSFLVSEKMKEQLNEQGVFQQFQGIPLMEVPQAYAPNSFDFLVDDNVLMFLPANTQPIKLVREGESMIKEVSDGTDNMDMTLEHTFLDNFGIAVVFSRFYGMYDMS